ncbi:glycosyltransferase family 34 protein [Zalerion maritima]|uniref:Glycosyltransferase family 34 protein n=1 Tax=Zalerion maritima TaxID=339359 RepID=A0AAD5RVV4_9PEZI|nr:glycosyltransferase family 34 protein [Zalerion maritima]
MHLAYPPRKSSTAGKYMPRQKMPRISRNKKTAIIIGSILVFFWWLLFSGSKRTSVHPSASKGVAEHFPTGKPSVVMVTVLDTSFPKEYTDSIKQNREEYANMHGYGTLISKVGDYDLHGSPFSWSKVVAMRHAMAKYPDAKWIWYLDQDGFIMDPKTRLHDLISDKALEQAMIKDQPVVPPDSIIKTFTHLKGQEVELVLTQDKDGISVGSFAVRNGEWAKFMLDTWYDPMYRSYNFQKAEIHAMEHILQWHPTLLSKLAVIPQKLINAYQTEKDGDQFQDGDFVLRLTGCTKGDGEKSCDREGGRIAQKWRTAFKNA